MITRWRDENKKRVSDWFEQLRDEICVALEALEDEAAGSKTSSNSRGGRFQRKEWYREPSKGFQGHDGGGVMSVLRGRVFEKAGVNVSTVHGEFSEEFRASIPGAESDPKFWASGISVVIHPRSPLLPIAHMNTRMIVTTQGWFGGGGDLTPVFPDDAETAQFHKAFKDACDSHDPDYYLKFKKWCDDYFFLKHRNEPRGIGGIFFDYLQTGDWGKDFEFVQDLGVYFQKFVSNTLEKLKDEKWNDDDKEKQLIKRSRYAEFNLLYDRGTKFGLETGGNIEAILMSMPPLAKWE